MKKAVMEAFETIKKMNELVHGIDRKVDVLSTRVDALDKRIDDWRDATKTYFVVLGLVVAVAGTLVPILLRIL